MSRNSEIDTYLLALMEESRQLIGDPPSSRELLAYHHGQLSDENAEQVREYLAHDRATMDQFLDLTAHIGDPGDPDYISDEKLEKDWETLRRRLELEETEIDPVLKTIEGPTHRRLWTERIVAVAAVVTVAITFGLQLRDRGRQMGELARQLEAPRLNEASFLLLPDGTRGARGETGEEPSIRIHLGPVGAHLSLALYESPDHENFRLDIRNAGQPESEAPRWSTDAIVLLPGDTFELGLPPSFLPPGEYILELYGVGDDDLLLASYSVWLEG